MRKLIAVFAALGLVAACQLETTVDTSFALYYSGVTEICPGTNITVTPTWHGDTPTDFAVTGVKLNSRAYQTECFTVDPQSGVFSASQTDSLPTGDWKIGISCVSAGETYSYENAVEFTLMRPVPKGIWVEPELLKVDMADVLSGEDLPTAQVKTDGNNHVTIKKYIISNVYLNGVLNETAKEWFSVSKSGVISVVAGNQDILPGIYTFDLRLTTYAAGEDDEDGLFKSAMRINVTSRPLSLSYSPAAMKVEENYGGKTVAPTLKGSPDSLVYKIKSVTPAGVDVTIDEVTGKIKFPEDSPAKLGEVYKVSVTVTNKYGSADFDDVYSFTIIDFIRPITYCNYNDVSGKISGVSISNPCLGTDGDEVSYLFKDLPAGLKGLTIDAATGEVKCEKGVELEAGNYDVTVIARNTKGDFESTFKLEILKNPYKFTTVFWGNNMGLTPEEDYGNQFRMFWGDEPLTIPIKYSDLPEGQPVTFTYTYGFSYSTSKTGVTVDSKTGTVTIYSTQHMIYHYSSSDKHYYYSQTDFNSNRVHVNWITVTCGTGEAAVTKMFPFFVQHVAYSGSTPGFTDGEEHSIVNTKDMDNAYQVLYTPFAFRVNPKKGGRSAAPVVSHLDGRTINQFTLDYRRNFCYYNFYGPAAHAGTAPVGGVMSVANKNLLYTLWQNYATSTGTVINVQASSAVGYWANNNYLKNWTGYTACYVDPTDLAVVVNPEKWQDDNGYANGAFVANMQFNINNVSPASNSNNSMQTLPIIIWLDDTYNK